MHVFVVRIPIHGLFRVLVWIKHSVDLAVVKTADIGIADAFLTGDMKNIADRMP